MARTKNTGKKSQTVRERSLSSDKPKSRRVRSTAGKIARPFKRAKQVGKKEYHPVKVSHPRLGVLNKRVRLFPRFLRDAWQELRLVTWPDARQTISLTMAVFIFSVIFAVIVGTIDFGLDKLFREVVIGK